MYAMLYHTNDYQKHLPMHSINLGSHSPQMLHSTILEVTLSEKDFPSTHVTLTTAPMEMSVVLGVASEANFNDIHVVPAI